MNIANALFSRIQLQQFSVNHLIQWGDHLSVEHSGIDAQHKAIFDLGTRVYENWRAGGCVDVLHLAVDKLANLLEDHFFFEERLLVEIGYDGLDEHVAEHRNMLDEFVIMKQRIHAYQEGREASGGSLLAPGWPIMQLILGLTIGHVMSSDMAYCRVLVAGRGPTRETA